MAKSKVSVPSIFTISKYLKPENLIPVYFFFGEDLYSIENAVRAIENAVQPLITSEFDVENFNSQDKEFADIIDTAYTFPFGSGKRLLIFKGFEDKKDSKTRLTSYLKNVNDSTVFVIIRYGSISNLEVEPYTSLLKKDFLFEAKELKGDELISWILKFTARKGKNINPVSAGILVDMVGENRTLIEMQLQKIFAFLGDAKEITNEVIKTISSELKEYTIFDLQNAIGVRNKTKAFETAFNLLDKGKDALFIIAMLNRYFTAIAQIPELEKSGKSDFEISRAINVSSYYYKDYKQASRYFKDLKMIEIAHALLEADISLKSTAMEQKTLISVLITQILS
jgi:DNA polymerase III subunit delta